MDGALKASIIMLILAIILLIIMLTVGFVWGWTFWIFLVGAIFICLLIGAAITYYGYRSFPDKIQPKSVVIPASTVYPQRPSPPRSIPSGGVVVGPPVSPGPTIPTQRARPMKLRDLPNLPREY